MKKTKTHCLLTYLYYIALFTLAYFLVFFVIKKYNETHKFEEFTGGLPIMTGNKSGNYAAWIIIIVVGFGMLSFVSYMIFKNVKQKRSFNKLASNLFEQLSQSFPENPTEESLKKSPKESPK